MANYNKVFSVKIYSFYYWFQRILAWFLYKIIFSTTIEGQENIDFSKTFIIVANHNSFIDPPLVGFAVPRPIAYMTNSRFFNVPILKKIIHWSGAYAIDLKNKNTTFINNTVYALDHGWLVTIFPEGNRSTDGRLMAVKPGLARILVKKNVPILPVAIIGANKAWGKGGKFKPRAKMTVKVGKMIYPQDYLPAIEMSEEEKVEYIRKIYAQKLNDLLPEEQKTLLLS